MREILPIVGCSLFYFFRLTVRIPDFFLYAASISWCININYEETVAEETKVAAKKSKRIETLFYEGKINIIILSILKVYKEQWLQV